MTLTASSEPDGDRDRWSSWPRRCPAQTTVTSPPVGVMSRTLDRGLSASPCRSSTRTCSWASPPSNAAASVAFPASDGDLGALLASGGRYYLEVVTGPLAGERLDVDTEATLASADSTLTLDLGAGSFSTLRRSAGRRSRRAPAAICAGT